jgi:hypothetical protein
MKMSRTTIAIVIEGLPSGMGTAGYMAFWITKCMSLFQNGRTNFLGSDNPLCMWMNPGIKVWMTRGRKGQSHVASHRMRGSLPEAPPRRQILCLSRTVGYVGNSLSQVW